MLWEDLIGPRKRIHVVLMLFVINILLINFFEQISKGFLKIG
jgi:hypothetical protein